MGRTSGRLEQESDFPAVGVDAVITLPAIEHNAYVIQHMVYSYSAAPTAGNITIVSGATTIYDVDHARAGEYLYNDKEDGIETGVGEEVVITLANASVTPKLFIQYRKAL